MELRFGSFMRASVCLYGRLEWIQQSPHFRHAGTERLARQSAVFDVMTPSVDRPAVFNAPDMNYVEELGRITMLIASRSTIGDDKIKFS